MADITAFWQQLKQGKNGEKKRQDYWIFLILLGILLLVVVWPVSGEKGKTEEQSLESVDKTEETVHNYAEQYATEMEKRLKEMLEKVEGVGTVQVMITLKNSGEQVVEKDRNYTEDKTEQKTGEEGHTTSTTINKSESTIYDQTSGGTPYVVKQLEPEIEGVLVAAQGAGDTVVMNEITYAVQVLFDVPVHKIKVVKMSSR